MDLCHPVTTVAARRTTPLVATMAWMPVTDNLAERVA
jgi:hypothetical protein